MFAISRAWYNGSYTMVAKPIKSLELHYTMIQFLIVVDITVLFHFVFSLADGDLFIVRNEEPEESYLLQIPAR